MDYFFEIYRLTIENISINCRLKKTIDINYRKYIDTGGFCEPYN